MDFTAAARTSARAWARIGSGIRVRYVPASASGRGHFAIFNNRNGITLTVCLTAAEATRRYLRLTDASQRQTRGHPMTTQDIGAPDLGAPIHALVDELHRALQAKGYATPDVSIDFKQDFVRIWARTSEEHSGGPRGLPGRARHAALSPQYDHTEFRDGQTLAEAVAKMQECIAGALPWPDRSNDAWFEIPASEPATAEENDRSKVSAAPVEPAGAAIPEAVPYEEIF